MPTTNCSGSYAGCKIRISHLESYCCKIESHPHTRSWLQSLVDRCDAHRKPPSRRRKRVRKYAQKLDFKIKTEDYSKLIHPSKEMIQEAAHKISFPQFFPQKIMSYLWTQPNLSCVKSSRTQFGTIDKTALDELKNTSKPINLFP